VGGEVGEKERGDIIQVQGGPAIFAYYSRSIAAALQDIYPDLAIDESKFSGIIEGKK